MDGAPAHSGDLITPTLRISYNVAVETQFDSVVHC